MLRGLAARRDRRYVAVAGAVVVVVVVLRRLTRMKNAKITPGK
jgi:hypothetical protein